MNEIKSLFVSLVIALAITTTVVGNVSAYNFYSSSTMNHLEYRDGYYTVQTYGGHRYAGTHGSAKAYNGPTVYQSACRVSSMINAKSQKYHWSVYSASSSGHWHGFGTC